MLLNLSTEANITLVKLYKIALIICVSNGLADIFNPKSIIFEKLEEKTKYNGDKPRLTARYNRLQEKNLESFLIQQIARLKSMKPTKK